MGINSSTPALDAVAYPMGVVGVILAVLLIRKSAGSQRRLGDKRKRRCEQNLHCSVSSTNPAIFNKSIKGYSS
ncbi:hypothetical protein NXV05_21275 [Parabacteroides johnsonii]|nr:hypothetical protein [Parabacteroides johnsonii]